VVFQLDIPVSPSPLWLPDSILLCALLRAPPRHWWLFLLLIFPIRLLGGIVEPRPMWFLLGTTGVDAAKGLAGALAVRLFTHDPSRLSSWRDWLAMGAVLLVAAVSAFPGAAMLRAAGNSDYWLSWRLWFLGDALAQLVVTPALLTWLLWKGPALPASTAGKIEAAILFGGLTAASYLAFSSNTLLNFVDSRFFLPIPFLYWAALRFGMAGASIAVPIIAFFALDSVLLRQSIGLLQQTIFFDPHPVDATFVLARFLLFRTLPVYVVAGLVEQRHRAERLVRESEARFRLMANSAPVLVWMSGTDKLCTFFNQVWLDFTGRPLAMELGNGWAEGVHPHDLERCLDTYVTAFDARKPFRMEYRLRNRDGHYRWILDIGVPRFDLDQTFCGYIGSAIDITDQKQAQEDIAHIGHLQRLAHMGELTASIAHELRQPLSGILLHAETLRLLLRAAGASSPQVEEILNDIGKDGQRAGNVLVSIRDLVQKRDEREARFEPLDINALVINCQTLISNEAARRRVRIATELARDLPLVTGASTEVTQVLLNLVFNAMDAMAETAPASRCVTLRTERRNDGVEVSVLDQGHGIKPEDLPRLFEAFFTTRTKGMGLGLSIVASIVQVHHGRVWAENRPTGGAAFLFTLPAAP
jgi:PAS domain S-box-containing protein